MTKTRKQAQYRRKIADVFFIFLIINLILKAIGVSSLEASAAMDASQALGMETAYFFIPVFFLLLGLFFVRLSKGKSLQAHNIEMSGSWRVESRWIELSGSIYKNKRRSFGSTVQPLYRINTYETFHA
jgi:hypothetical protein